MPCLVYWLNLSLSFIDHEDESQRGSTGSAGHSSMNQLILHLNVRHFFFDWSMPLNEAVAISFIILVFAVCHGSELELGARHIS